MAVASENRGSSKDMMVRKSTNHKLYPHYGDVVTFVKSSYTHQCIFNGLHCHIKPVSRPKGFPLWRPLYFNLPHVKLRLKLNQGGCWIGVKHMVWIWSEMHHNLNLDNRALSTIANHHHYQLPKKETMINPLDWPSHGRFPPPYFRISAYKDPERQPDNTLLTNLPPLPCTANISYQQDLPRYPSVPIIASLYVPPPKTSLAASCVDGRCNEAWDWWRMCL